MLPSPPSPVCLELPLSPDFLNSIGLHLLCCLKEINVDSMEPWPIKATALCWLPLSLTLLTLRGMMEANCKAAVLGH